MIRRPWMPVCGLLLLAFAGNALGAAGGLAANAGSTGAGWPTFDYDAFRSGVVPGGTAITARNLHQLRRRAVKLDGAVDSSPIQLSAIKVGTRRLNVVVVTTSYGKAIALNPRNGKKLWEFVPADIANYIATPQITTASPVADPTRRYIYSASPDGMIHKLDVRSGHQRWSARATLRPSKEKISGSLNVSGTSVIVTTSGYFDHQPYIGHVVLIDRATGRVTHVWNSMCSTTTRLIDPAKCPQATTQSTGGNSIWGRAGAVVEPRTGRILVATGNGPFDGVTTWGESVLELSPRLKLLHNWTPADEEQLTVQDEDLGSTAPALLPLYHGYHLAVQGGKQGILSLLDRDRLDGTTRAAGPLLGGELQDIQAPASSLVFTAPVAWSHGGRIFVFVSDFLATAAYVLGGGSHPRLRVLWHRRVAGTSPVLVRGLLYVYDKSAGLLRVLQPETGKVLIALAAGVGHWNSPIVVGGRIILPEGNADVYRSSAAGGTLDIYHLPGW